MMDSCGSVSRQMSRRLLRGLLVATLVSGMPLAAVQAEESPNAAASSSDGQAPRAQVIADPATPSLPPAAKANNSIFRCVQSGVPTWQQQPCQQGDTPVTLDDSLTVVPAADVVEETSGEDPTAQRLAREKERALAAREESQRQYRIRSALDDGYLVQGMSEAQAISLLGKPSDISETIADDTSCRLLNWWEDVRVQFCNDEAVSITANQLD